MVESRQTRYARNGPVNLAYQTAGEGPIDVLHMAAGTSHLEVEFPAVEHFVEQFERFSRLTLYDKRGCGLSDRTVDPPTIAEAVSDAVAILDELGVEHVHVFATFDSGAAALALAAAHPDRVTSVALYGPICRSIASEDFPWGLDPVEAEALPDLVESTWGGTGLLGESAPNYVDDPVVAEWFTRVNRASISPAGAATWFRNLLAIDIRSILDDVAVPVLITNRTDTGGLNAPGQSRYLAEHLPDARQVEFPGEDYLLWVGDTDAILDEVEEFFTGTRPTHAPTRALATVVFTDIVGSTEQAADVGDTAWRELLARHDGLTRQHVEAHDGRVVKSTGDGALATFDDPEDAIAAAQGLITGLKAAGLDIRVGIHFGKIEITGDDVAGIAVHLAARISALAESGDIYVSRGTADLMLGSPIEFDDRGAHDLKGIPGTWDILAVVGDPSP